LDRIELRLCKAMEGCDGMASNVYVRVGLILQRMVGDIRNGKIGSYRYCRQALRVYTRSSRRFRDHDNLSALLMCVFGHDHP
jgi:hypothetical protein